MIIAEAGVNHNGLLDLAKQLVVEAKKAGAVYVKFQTSVPEKLVSTFAEMAEYQKTNIGKTESQLDMVKKIMLFWRNFAHGFMATAMSSTLTEEQRSKIYARTSLKAATSIRSVAETVAFLLSERAESITVQNIHVDNGTI